MSHLGFVFPGQGSQVKGMLADFTDVALVQDTFKQASDVLGYDLWQLIQTDPDDRINKTEFTQPALLTSSIAIWRVWQDRNGSLPHLVAGHSLGEYSALVAASVLELADAVSLVQKRGRYMQEAVPVGQGSMAAILGLADEAVVDICAEVTRNGIVQAANFNAPGQVVIAGDTASVDLAIDRCREAGARKAMSLPVSAPFHCTLMQPAADRMGAELDAVSFGKPVIPIIQNVTADFADQPESIRSNLKAQICSPVRWTETVQRLHSEGCEQMVECGPGRVLNGLAKRIERGIQTWAISDPETIILALADQEE